VISIKHAIPRKTFMKSLFVKVWKIFIWCTYIPVFFTGMLVATVLSAIQLSEQFKPPIVPIYIQAVESESIQGVESFQLSKKGYLRYYNNNGEGPIFALLFSQEKHPYWRSKKDLDKLALLYYDHYNPNLQYIGIDDLDSDGMDDFILWDSNLDHGLASVHTRIIYWKNPQDGRPIITSPLMYGYVPKLIGKQLIFSSLTAMGLEKTCSFKNGKLFCGTKEHKPYLELQHYKSVPW
jgi:hypothetical protein